MLLIKTQSTLHAIAPIKMNTIGELPELVLEIIVLNDDSKNLIN